MSPSYDSTTSLKGVEKVSFSFPDYVVLTFYDVSDSIFFAGLEYRVAGRIGVE